MRQCLAKGENEEAQQGSISLLPVIVKHSCIMQIHLPVSHFGKQIKMLNPNILLPASNDERLGAKPPLPLENQDTRQNQGSMELAREVEC